MGTSSQQVLEAAVELLRQFVEPSDEVISAVCQQAGVTEPEDLPEWHIILTRALRPKDSDYALIFRGDAAARAQKGYTELWEEGHSMVITPKRDQTYLRAAVIPAAAIGTDPAARDQFPGGYRDIVEDLQPDRYWLAWEFFNPAEGYGTQWNGLVYLEERFVFCPKPWRVL